MEFYKYLIIYIAVFVGSVLLFLGIKNIKLKSSKKSLFMATLLSVLFFSSCSDAQVTNNDNSVFIEQSDKIIKLNELADWQKIKVMWQELNNVPPENFSSYTEPLNPKNVSYQFKFDNNEIKKQQLDSLISINLQNIKNSNILTDDELWAVEIIFKKRIEFLYTVNFMIFSHFLPPKINTNLEASLEKLEFKIDTLINMQNNAVIDEVEFKEAINVISAELKNILTVSVILSDYNDYIFEGNYDDENTVENNLMYFENHFKTTIDKHGSSSKYQQIYDDINSDLNKITDAIEGIDEVVADLLGNQNTRIIVIEKTQAYSDFKEFWHQIDTIYREDYSIQKFDFEVFERIEDMKIKLDEYIVNLYDTKLLTVKEVEVIEELTLIRLNAIGGPNLYTRMYIQDAYYPTSIFEFEKKIDVLLNLKEDGLIDEVEYKNALQDVFNLSNKSIMLYMIFKQPIFGSYTENQFDNDITAFDYIDDLTEVFQNIIDNDETLTQSYTDFYNSISEQLLEVNTAMPFVHQFIKSLEN